MITYTKFFLHHLPLCRGPLWGILASILTYYAYFFETVPYFLIKSCRCSWDSSFFPICDSARETRRLLLAHFREDSSNISELFNVFSWKHHMVTTQKKLFHIMYSPAGANFGVFMGSIWHVFLHLWRTVQFNIFSWNFAQMFMVWHCD